MMIELVRRIEAGWIDSFSNLYVVDDFGNLLMVDFESWLHSVRGQAH